MFDITSSKLLLLGIVALLVIGPKDLPALLRTIGKYMGIVKRHAAEFRAQFDEAMREAEFDQLKKDVEKFAQETESGVRAAGEDVERELDAARASVDTALEAPPTPVAEGLPAPAPDALPVPNSSGAAATSALGGPVHEDEAVATADTQVSQPAEKSGA